MASEELKRVVNTCKFHILRTKHFVSWFVVQGQNMVFGSESFKLYLSIGKYYWMALPWEYPATRLVFFSPALPFLLSILPQAFLSEFSPNTSSVVHLHPNQSELEIIFKRTVNVNSSEPPCKNVNSGFTMVHLKTLWDQA